MIKFLILNYFYDFTLHKDKKLFYFININNNLPYSDYKSPNFSVIGQSIYSGANFNSML
jgi:hypothetical protein